MAQIETDFYMNYAYQFHLSQEAMDGADGYLLTALTNVVNVIASDYSGDATAAVEVELALLQPTKTAYSSLQNSINSISSTLDAVRAINGYVISNATGTGSATTKLDDFINSLTWNAITGQDQVPYFWWTLCVSAGYDVDGWDSKDPSA